MHNGYGRVHGACLLPTGRSTLAFLFHDCFCLGTPCFCSLSRPFFRILRLFDFTLCGYLCCETCAFAFLFCRLLVNAPFCYYKRLLYRWICLLPPLVLTLSCALFSLTLPRDPNGKDQPKKHLLLARRRRLPQSFFIILHHCMYERRVSSFLCMQDLTSSSDVGRLYVKRKFLVNWLSSSPQLPMESLGRVLNQDRDAPVRRNCRLCIAVALVPLSIWTACR
jgi:hypothetical protein